MQNPRRRKEKTVNKVKMYVGLRERCDERKRRRKYSFVCKVFILSYLTFQINELLIKTRTLMPAC